MQDSSGPEFFTARDIARALNRNKKFVARLAERDAWPVRQRGNRREFLPPEPIVSQIIATPDRDRSPVAAHEHATTFSDLAGNDAAREKVLQREHAVLTVISLESNGRERALHLACEAVAAEFPDLHCSVSSLRRWRAAYSALGLDGLVEQKRGRSGSKPFALDLQPEDVLRYRAQAIEHGVDGRLNVARAYQNMVADPTITGPARAWLHGDRASKSYVPPSVRSRLQTAPLAVRHIQIGPKAAKLDGPYTECTYDDVPAGRAFTADDMTANCYVWTEWPNESGFLLIRPQILAVLDVGSLAWQNLRAIIRPKGQYNKDDVWGLVGDYLDAFGLHLGADGRPDPIAVFEGGTWQSANITGVKTGLDDATRFAGLRSLGIKLIHTRSPRGKIIETAFNSLQYAADAVRGFCGRDERHDCPEPVKQQLYQVRAGHAHPRQFFLHLNEYTAHLAGVMQQLNHERSDGKVLRGLTPADKWVQDNPQFLAFPDTAKWMYRSAYRICQVTRNGVRITVGTGKYQISYTYSHPDLEAHRGRRVVTYWNDHDPDTDAVIFSLRSGRPDKQICVASRVATLSRFGATADQMHDEAARKRLSQQLCVSESRTLAPYLQRRTATSPIAHRPSPIASPGEAIARAAADQVNRIRSKKHLRDFTRSADELLTPDRDRSPVAALETRFDTDSLQADPDRDRSPVAAPETRFDTEDLQPAANLSADALL